MPGKPKAHQRADRFDFDLERRTSIYLCRHVAAGAPVLQVVHDHEDDWQFLCGIEHDDEDPVPHCLECLVAGDPSLNDLAALGPGHYANREQPGAAWQRGDDTEDQIEADIAERGWHAALIEAGESESEPAFAYTVGLPTSFDHPELLCFGLPVELLHTVLEACVARIKGGAALAVGSPIPAILDAHAVKLRPVRAKRSYDNHLGYAIGFHGGRDFAVLQILWPDKAGHFPDELQVDPLVASRQPLLP